MTTLRLAHSGSGIPGALSPSRRRSRIAEPTSHVTVRTRRDPLEVRPVFLTAFETELLCQVLAAQEAQACRDLAGDISAQWSRPVHPSMERDATPPHGIPRGRQ